jgi:folate-binding protein YgfZ
MNTDWLDRLAARGAQVHDGDVSSFGDIAAELQAAASGSVTVPLTRFGVLDFSGADCADFLHGQVSCDVKALAAGRSTFGTYNTPKGRMLASFLLWRTPDGFRMLLPQAVLPAVHKRLQMFVMRAKVKVADRAAVDVLIGASGPEAPAAVVALAGTAPAQPHGVTDWAGGSVLAVPGDRFIVTVATEQADACWQALSAMLRPAGAPCWDWLDIVNGIAFVVPPTQDQFVPQMANMELVGGVSFKKGCYPGQEIVARTQYLGKLKRRMYLARVDADPAPSAGDALFSDDTGDQANGLIAAAAPAPGGGWDCLAVVQSTSAEQSTVHLRALDGPALAFRALPYALE